MMIPPLINLGLPPLAMRKHLLLVLTVDGWSIVQWSTPSGFGAPCWFRVPHMQFGIPDSQVLCWLRQDGQS